METPEEKLCSECEDLLPVRYFVDTNSCRLCIKMTNLAVKSNPKWRDVANYTNEGLLANSQECEKLLTARREKGPCAKCGSGLVFWYRKSGEFVDVFKASDVGGFAPTFLPTYLKHFIMYCEGCKPVEVKEKHVDVESYFRTLAAKTQDETKKRRFLLMAAKAKRNKYATSVKR